MKKSAIVMFLLLIVSFAFATSYQIGSGGTTQYISPCNGYYNNGWSKIIITASELSNAGFITADEITRIGLNISNTLTNSTLANQTVYMRHTDQTIYNSSSQTLPNVSDFTQVYQGSVTFNGTGWQYFELDQAFLYNALSGIEIVWENRNGAWTNYYPVFYSTTLNENRVCNAYTDSGFPSTTTGTLNAVRPNIQLITEQAAPPNHAILSYPDNGSSIVSTTTTLGWIDGGGFTEGYKLYFGSTNPPTFVQNLSNTTFSYQVNNLAQDTEYYWQIVPYNQHGDSQNCPIWSFHANPAGLVIVGDGTSVHRYPFGHLYGYERSAGLYSSNDIGTLGIITNVGWFCSTVGTASIPYKIWMGTQSANSFTQQDWSTFSSNLTMVKQGEYTFSSVGWHTFNLDNPFTYVGDNLIVAVEVNIGGSGMGGYPGFYYTTSTAGTHLYWLSDTVPPTNSGNINTNRTNLMLQVTDLSSDPMMLASPGSHDFGVLPFGEQSEPKMVNITNIGGGTLVIDESNISLSGTHADMFGFDASVLPFNLSTGTLGALPIFVTGSVEGEISATLTITYSGAVHNVELSAEVLPEGIIEVYIGHGINVNNSNSGATPYMGFYKNYRMHNIIKASEIMAAGGIPGFIDAISYNVLNVNAYSPMPNYRISLKHTNLESFNSFFETGEYTQVFQSDSFMPNQGWSTHYFDTPFLWDGVSNIIVETITDMVTGTNTQNASVYYNSNNYNCSIIFSSNTQQANSATSGNVSTMRPNVKLTMRATDAQDMAAYSINGPLMPNINTESIYRVKVRNLAPDAVSNYSVKIMSATGEELSSVAGPVIQPLEILEINVPWIPTQLGTQQIYGRVEMPGDELPQNNNTALFTVEVFPAGYTIIQFGFGAGTNSTTGGPTPYGTYYKAFREQHLLTVDELVALSGSPGIINSVSYYVNAVNNCVAMPNYRIRLKHTSQTALTTTFETGTYTEVYQHNSFTPVAGWNEHIFSQPFFWNGSDNLLIDIVTDVIQTGYTYNAAVLQTPTGFNSSLRYQSDSVSGATATTGTSYTVRPNLRLKMTVEDMGSLSGVVMEGAYPVENALVSVANTVFSTRTNANGEYYLPFVNAGLRTVTASRYGYANVSQQITIVHNQAAVLNFDLVGTPEFGADTQNYDFGAVRIGESAFKVVNFSNIGGNELIVNSISISGSDAFTLSNLPSLPISLRGSASSSFRVNFAPYRTGLLEATVTVSDNAGRSYSFGVGSDRDSSRQNSSIFFSGNGTSELTIGEGNDNARVPFDFYWQNSVFQTVLTNDELGGFIGQITGIRLYNNFYSNINSYPIKIYMARTLQNDLSAGWISSNNMTLVYNGTASFPSGQNTIEIAFPQPFEFFDGGNLVMLFHRPMDTGWHSSSDYFKTQTWGSSRSLNIYSDSTTYDTSNMSGGELSGEFPKITFITIPGGVGHISGYVRNEAGEPLANVSIDMDERSLATTDPQGHFMINSILPGNYRLSLSRHAYHDSEYEFFIEEDDELEIDITMIEMQKVPVSGTVIASDTGEGIAGATLYIFGYDDFELSTEDDGSFVVSPGVYADFSYEYIINATGYTTVSGNINVGSTAYNMGQIVMNEVAYAPTQVAATINATYTAVNIGWNPPDPDALEIIESFEGIIFPPDQWSQAITNTGVANQFGAMPTWSRFGPAEGVSPSDGAFQAGLTWIAEHQDEWLFSPVLTCPPDAYLKFDTHLNMGSDGGDHYYVKVSTNNGVNWQVLWDGAAQPLGLNSYDTPIVIDLSDYAEQEIKLAWHADDGFEGFGMWFNWYIDNVYIGNFVRTEQISSLGSTISTKNPSKIMNPTRGENVVETNTKLALKATSDKSRALIGYKVWRMRAGQEETENNWVLLNNEALTETGFEDTNWGALAQGDYVWAIRAVYTSDVMSLPVFSNTLTKESSNGTVSGFVRSSEGNRPIAGATVSAAGQYNATTTANGFYNISLPAGTYTVTAFHESYHELSYEDIAIYRDENTTVNFIMSPVSNKDVIEITVTALNSNYPNPFNPETTISYDIKEPGKVRLDVFNLKGQLVRTLVNDEQSTGRYNVVFNATDDRGNKLSSGLYFYRLRAGDYIKTRKMMLME